jgi:hypothetical protein
VSFFLHKSPLRVGFSTAIADKDAERPAILPAAQKLFCETAVPRGRKQTGGNYAPA